MAKQFACKDIGLQCGFTAKANDEKSLMKKIQQHAKSAHRMNNIDSATAAKIKDAIREA